MKLRVVLSKVGLDGHDVGINLIAKGLVEQGHEVVYLGKRVSTEQIVRAAVAEDADVIGVSCLSGGLAHFATGLVARLREEEAPIPVVAGGIDEPAEIEGMLRDGVARYFGPGAETHEVVDAFAALAEACPPAGTVRG